MKCFFSLRIVCLLALGLPVWAQNTAGTGSISGTVQDASGAIVPGASVLIENESKGIRRELTTTEGGVFSAPSLVPADGYSVRVSKGGFSTYELKNVQINVGATISLKATLQVASAATQVQVSDEAPIVESTKSDVSQVIGSRQLLDLPINGRRVDSFVLLTPAVTQDAAFGLLSFRGLAGGNAFLTDGIDTTNQYYNENAGRTRTYNISQDAVQEFQVITSNFLAEYGRASGGVINTITRSGTNDLHGTAYWFFRNRTLNATDPTANGFNGQDWRHQVGGSIGGPIVKNKVFYFFNYEAQRREFPIISSNRSNLSIFNPSAGGYVPTSGGRPNCQVGGTGGASAAQCAAAVDFLTSRAQTQSIARTADVDLGFGKIDYQINERNRLTTEFNLLQFKSPNGIQTQQSLTTGAGVGNNADTNVFDRTGKIGLTSTLSPTAVNEFKFGFFKDRQFDPASPTLLPETGPAGLTVANISNLGYATSYPRLNPSETRFQAADTLSYTVGKHSLKFGVDYAHTEDYVNQLSNQFGTYNYSTLTNFALDFSNPAATKHWNTYSQTFGQPVFDVKLHEIAGFVQDEWRVTPKLTISPGIRYEKTILPSLPRNGALSQTSNLPETSLNFGPRFGIAYAFNDKTVFRGGYGIFYDRYVTSTIGSLITGNGNFQKSYSLNATGFNGAAQLAAGPSFPNALVAPPANVNGSASVSFADNDYRNPYSQQANIAIERQLTRNSSLSVSYIWSRGLHLASARDANAATPTASYTFPILNTQNQPVSAYTTPLYTQRLNPQFGAITELDSSLNSYYNALTIQYQKRFSGWVQGQAAYTYGHAIDYGIGGAGNTLYTPYVNSVFNGDYRGEKGSASTDQRHRLVVNGIVTPKFTRSESWAARWLANNWQLSVVSTFGSAFPQVPQIFIGAANTHPGGLLSTATLNGLGGSRRVPFESLSALDIDQQYRTDARITKILPFSERFRVMLIFEATNVFNHPYVAGPYPARQANQYQTVAYNGGYALAPYPGYGSVLETQGPPDGTTARRAQAALRIEF